jgi:spermidine/putrescine transport system permease protein
MLFVAPLAVLVVYSFGRQSRVDLSVTIDWSLRQYRVLFGDLYRPTILRSLRLAGLTTVACLVIGFPTALAISRMPKRWGRVALAAIVVPSFVNFVVRTYAWVGLLGNGGTFGSLDLLYTPTGVGVGMVNAYLPLALLPMTVALQRIPTDLLESAADLGAGPLRRLRTIIVPLAAQGVLTAATLVLVLAVGEFTTPAVLGGGKTLLLGNLLADQAGGVNRPLGGAIAVLLLTLFAIIALLALVARRLTRVVAP